MTIIFTTCLILSNLVDDLGSFLDELCASHVRHLNLLQLGLRRGLGLPGSAAPVAWSHDKNADGLIERQDLRRGTEDYALSINLGGL